tara:strand:+ start:2701 stop:2904 length:204 start_codon:yes stop_codon:yes gene_type:complete
MVVLRESDEYQLNQGSLMASGMFNISTTDNKFVSIWFDKHTKDELLACDDILFIERAKNLIDISFVD